jgi:ferredoxin
VRIHLESSKCMGHAQCFVISEALFPVDEFGYSIVEPHEVSQADEERTRAGVDACPERALILDGCS